MTMSTVLCALLVLLKCASAHKNAEHVILVGLDGLQVSALHEALSVGNAPNLKMLRETGAYTDTARAQFPSVSLPNWGNVLYGTGLEFTGIPSNYWDRNAPQVYPNEGPCVFFPNVFTVAKLQNPMLKTAAFFSWDTLGLLLEPKEYIDHFEFDSCGSCEQCLDVEPRLADKFAVAFQKELFSLSFVYFDSTDECGHEYGTHNANYTKAIKMVDAAIGRILRAVKDAGVADKTITLVTSDHGREKCEGRDHGGFDQSEMTLQWIINGPGIQRDHWKLRSPVATMDNAPTMLHALGLEVPTQWRGRPVYEAFVRDARSRTFFVPVAGPVHPDQCKPVDDLRNCSTTQ